MTTHESGTHGSTAKAQFSRRYEANDVQYLLGLLADNDGIKRQAGQAAPFNVNPATVGGLAYSGGSMLTLWRPGFDAVWA